MRISKFSVVFQRSMRIWKIAKKRKVIYNIVHGYCIKHENAFAKNTIIYLCLCLYLYLCFFSLSISLYPRICLSFFLIKICIVKYDTLDEFSHLNKSTKNSNVSLPTIIIWIKYSWYNRFVDYLIKYCLFINFLYLYLFQYQILCCVISNVS